MRLGRTASRRPSMPGRGGNGPGSARRVESTRKATPRRTQSDATESWNQRDGATFLSGGRSRVLPSEAGISGDDDPGRTAGSFSSVAGTDSNFFVLQNARSPKIVIALCTIRGV